MLNNQYQASTTYITEQPVVTGLLNQALRNQISALNQPTVTGQTLQQSFLAIAKQAVTASSCSSVREKLFVDAYNQAIKTLAKAQLTEAQMTDQFINEHGLVMSVLNCTTTIKDVHRNSIFYKAVFELIGDLLQRSPQINIAYPACGPFAPMLLPILLYMDQQHIISPKTVRVSLIDIQPGAIQSLKVLINELQLSAYFEGVYHADAVLFKGSQPFDIFIAEAFQHGFSKEAHLNICKNFARQLSNHGVMLPCKTKVNAALVKCQREFVEQWQQQPHNEKIKSAPNSDILSERIELGNVLTLDRHTLLTLDIIKLGEQQVARCNTLAIPASTEDASKRVLVLYAEVMTYNEHWLTQYQSGITHPLPFLNVCIDFEPQSATADDLLLSSTDKITFYYKLTGLTGFLPTKAEQQVSYGAN
ncbi:hypothetical protein [Pseudoalteromonas sp. ASV78]|uniref:hypothetical protein n=1 Tax=Pseudoalteromonas sp. ASV78 TaxID=3397851 RepID=UPI0039FDD091